MPLILLREEGFENNFNSAEDADAIEEPSEHSRELTEETKALAGEDGKACRSKEMATATPEAPKNISESTAVNKMNKKPWKELKRLQKYLSL